MSAKVQAVILPNQLHTNKPTVSSNIPLMCHIPCALYKTTFLKNPKGIPVCPRSHNAPVLTHASETEAKMQMPNPLISEPAVQEPNPKHCLIPHNT